MSGDERHVEEELHEGERVVEGEWVDPPVSYVDPQRRFCAYCGRPIARRFWSRRGVGQDRVYCSPGHGARHDISLEHSGGG
jgi:hypothetical protein